jgi:hypothetical protein
MASLVPKAIGRFEGGWSGWVVGGAWLCILLLTCGCRTAAKAPLFQVAGPGWRVQEGQALWTPSAGLPSLGGEVLLASHPNGSSLVQFAKTPFTFVLGQTTRTNWMIQFPPRQLGFSGRNKPSTRFAWLYLGTALAAEPLPPDYSFERRPEGGWRLENTRSGEILEGFLAP